jgi:hypothetical protein
MNNKQTISKINKFSSILKEIKVQLINEDELNISDVLIFNDILDEIQLTNQKIQDKTKNIFMKAGSQNISDDVKDLYGRMEEIENKRLLQDEEILTKLHEILFKEDYLELNFFHLNPEDIEMILTFLDDEINDILVKKPFNEQIINPIIDEIKRKLVNLHFRYDFPIIDELDEAKNSYAHRIILMANEIKETNPKKAAFLINKIDQLLDLVWLSKMFIYGDIKKAQSLFDKLDKDLKNKIEKFVWRAKGNTLKQINTDKKWLLPIALMGYVAEKINA